MSVKHIAVYTCDGLYCMTKARVKSRNGKEYGYRDEYRDLEKRGWYFTGLVDGMKHYCKKCAAKMKPPHPGEGEKEK